MRFKGLECSLRGKASDASLHEEGSHSVSIFRGEGNAWKRSENIKANNIAEKLNQSDSKSMYHRNICLRLNSTAKINESERKKNIQRIDQSSFTELDLQQPCTLF